MQEVVKGDINRRGNRQKGDRDEARCTEVKEKELK